MSPTDSTFSPMMILVANATRSTPSVLDTKGKERETRTLHSITFSWSSYGQNFRSGLVTLRHADTTLLTLACTLILDSVRVQQLDDCYQPRHYCGL